MYPGHQPRSDGFRARYLGGALRRLRGRDAVDGVVSWRAEVPFRHQLSQFQSTPALSASGKKDAFTQFVGTGMSQLIDANGNPYQYMSGDDLYPTTGDMLEYMYEVLPGRPNFVPELRPKDSAPLAHYFSGLPEDEIEPTFTENLGAALALINCAGFDRPSAEVTIHWDADTQVGQVVRNCWKVFDGLRLL